MALRPEAVAGHFIHQSDMLLDALRSVHHCHGMKGANLSRRLTNSLSLFPFAASLADEDSLAGYPADHQ